MPQKAVPASRLRAVCRGKRKNCRRREMPAMRGAAVLDYCARLARDPLLPHPLVVHLHAVEILAHLVRHDADDIFRKRLPPAIRTLTGSEVAKLLDWDAEQYRAQLSR